ncbi:MAG: NfrA family protein [Polaromonas sp.]
MKTIFGKTPTLALCLLALAAMAPGVHAQPALPLTGPAWVLADEAYKAFARGDYAMAREKASEALRLRPDAAQLQELMRSIDGAQGAPVAGTQAPARRVGARRAPVPAARSAAPTALLLVAPAPDPAFQAAADGYKAYDRADYAAAVASAQQAVRLAPLNRDYRLLLVNALLADGRLPEADQALTAGMTEAGDDGRLAAQQPPLRRRMQDAQAQALGQAAYSDFERMDFAGAAAKAGQALQLAPGNRDYQALLVSSLYRNGQYPEAEQQAGVAIARAPDASLYMQRGLIRQRMGRQAAAREDFEAALRMDKLAAATEIGLLLELDRKAEARQRFEQARADGSLAGLSGTELAYLAVRVGDDGQALEAFNRADASGGLANTAWRDAAFAAVRTGQDAQAIGYFKRAIDDTEAGKLALTPQQLFETRRAVAEVSREFGVIASLSYRGGVSGLGLPPGTATDSLQAGAEAYWRPWGFRNGRYTEVFARGFQTLYSKGGGATGSQTLQTAVGLRHKPLTDVNLVASLSRVFAASGGRDDWLAQLGYSGGQGGDLRVDVPSWWTSRVSAEMGRYLSAGQSYALVQADLGRSIRVGDSGKWVVFPHLSLAADYNSAALSRSSAGIGPGISARYWFRGDVYNAPRSYLDVALQYRWRVGGAPRAGGVFLVTTLSY